MRPNKPTHLTQHSSPPLIVTGVISLFISLHIISVDCRQAVSKRSKEKSSTETKRASILQAPALLLPISPVFSQHFVSSVYCFSWNIKFQEALVRYILCFCLTRAGDDVGGLSIPAWVISFLRVVILSLNPFHPPQKRYGLLGGGNPISAST